MHPNLLRLSPAAQTVLDAIAQVGGHPLTVGGAVRDALLDRVPAEIDIEVHGAADAAHLSASLARFGRI